MAMEKNAGNKSAYLMEMHILESVAPTLVMPLFIFFHFYRPIQFSMQAQSL